MSEPKPATERLREWCDNSTPCPPYEIIFETLEAYDQLRAELEKMTHAKDLWANDAIKRQAELEKCQADCAVLRSGLETIRPITTGENQVADTDTEAMGVIQKECDACLSTTSVQSLLDRLQKLEAQSQEDKRLIEILNNRWLAMSDKSEAERAQMRRWFERHHVTGDLTPEQIDAMSPTQMADHAYERMADRLEKREDALRKAFDVLERLKNGPTITGHISAGQITSFLEDRDRLFDSAITAIRACGIGGGE